MLLISIPETTRFIRHGHACLGVAGPDGLTLTAGGHSDSTLWSRNTASPDGHLHTWSPWGAGDTTGGLPGFNGERPDPVSGSYHLGNGYRTYSPALRRFTCPDSLSPFGAGGINPYAYCAGDPINRTDPTGHISWQGIVGIVGGIVGLGLSFIGGYMAIAAAEGIAAAVSSASATSLVVGGLGVAADVTAIASGATEDVNPAASSVLGWVSMATGIAGIAAGAAQSQRVVTHTSELKVIKHSYDVDNVLSTVRENSAWSLFKKRGMNSIPSGAQKIGRNFYLFSGGENSSRLIINAHGAQTILKSSANVPDGMVARFFTEDGEPLLYNLKHGAKGDRYPPIEELTGEIKNYRISKANEGGYERTRNISEDYNVDILNIRNRFRLGSLTLNDAFKIIEKNNLKYNILDVPICRSPYM
ncbi:RHS repeat-associated core domain-containing protein (plasmid) [Pantoea agglomerans]|uniref:RHS repeat-associated core domain-containing protein n=1 Tax=Enterobacter agglomerans TaxID=549 RepID=UPI002ED03957|nr:RHS repeat-associated core domain-containing protein [Pantoea agglomerans]